MGSTLTYGVYLPDEGERNCYSGLAQNWQILDDAVGAIAGKANASHTHGNITNNGAIGSTSGLPIITGNDGVLTTGTFGNTAGTFCEGNDSRLSDARTPVAHTHTKSDVTDLLNSNFIPSANNSYDLGSSSYQWNNFYAKNYFYNGVAWGLDQANTWTANQTIANISWSGATPPSATKTSIINFTNSDTTQGRLVNRVGANTTETWIVTIRNIDASTSYNSTLIHVVDNSGNIKLQPLYGDVALGASTSGNRFKTLNGINPGALSLPNYDKAANIDTDGWSTAGGRITYTPTVSGWLQITATGGSGQYITLLDSGTNPRAGQRITGDGIDRLFLTYPVVAGHTYWIYIVSSAIATARIVPCLGNV